MEEYPRVKVNGIEGYEEGNVHFDVNGKWGGKRAAVAHFINPNNKSNSLVYLYILVGGYFQVGKWPDDDPSEPSMWEVAKLVTAAMENGASRKKLYDAVAPIALRAMMKQYP